MSNELEAVPYIENLFSRGPAIVFLWRFQQDFPVEHVTDNVAQLGYSPEDFTSGRVSWSGVTHPADEPRLRREVEEALASGSDEFAQTYRLFDGDGRVRWIDNRNLIIRDAAGEITHIQGVIIDVTERKSAELNLRREHSDLEHSVESHATEPCFADGLLLQSAIEERRQLESVLLEMVERDQTTSKITAGYAYAFDVMEDGALKLVWIKGDFRRISGYTPETLAAAGGWRTLIFPEDAVTAQRQLETILQGHVSDVEYRIVRSDGSVRWQRDYARPVFDETETRVVRIYGAVRDITDTKLTDQELRDTNTYLETLIATSHDTILVVDAEGRFEFGNEAFLDMFGWPQSELIGEFFMKVIPPELHAFMLERWEEVQRGEGVPYETVVLTKHGERRTLLVSHRHMTIAGQRKYCVVCKDVSVRKQVERELDRHRRHLEDLVRDQTEELSLTVERLRDEIAERMQVEQALRASERRYRMLMEEAGDSVFVVSEALNIIDVNPAACELLGYPRERLLLTALPDHFDAAETELRRQVAIPATSGETVVETRHLRRSDGVYLTVEGTLRRTPDGNLVIFARDVSARRRVEQQILEAANNEQQRIGQALHDSLGQELTGIAFLTKALQVKLAGSDPELAGEASRLVDLVNQSLRHTRRIARGLSPVDVQAGGLEQALLEMAKGTEDLFGISCSFVPSHVGDIEDSHLASHLYHIAQESVTNAIRHGGANDITIALSARDGQGELSVRDNGKGLPENGTVRKGIGLGVMQYRAEMVGGYLQVGSNTDGGVTVRCSFEMT